MRLRLRIERHTIPPIQTVWPVTNSKYTIAQLLESINYIFPLEADFWGLEDYSVSLNDFELVHYHEIRAVCRDEDEIVIKPLTYTELRARTLNGREQITADGRHLVDGVPFGKPLLKGADRPEVQIPQRSMYKGLPDEAANEDLPLGLMFKGEDGEDEDEDEDDEEYGDESWDDDGNSESTRDNDESDGISDDNLESEALDLHEQSEQLSLPVAKNNSITTPSAESDSEISSSEDSLDSSDASHSSDISTSNASPPAPRPMALKTTAATMQTRNGNGTLPKGPAPTSTQSKRKFDSVIENEAAEGSEDDRPAKVAKSVGIPFAGLSRTRSRNARRRDTKRLAYLVSQKILPVGSNLQDLKSYDELNATDQRARDTLKQPQEGANTGDNPHTSEKRDPEPISANQLPASEADASNHDKARSAKKAKKKASVDPQVLEHARQSLLDQIAAGGIDATVDPEMVPLAVQRPDEDADDEEPPEEMTSQNPDTTSRLPVSENRPVKDLDAHPPPAAEPSKLGPVALPRRAKLDIASSQRLLFGSLGVRAPRTAEERSKVERQLAEKRRPTKGNVSSKHIENLEPAADKISHSGIDAWRSKINLRAVECCDEGVILSEPKFPFEKGWDSQYPAKAFRHGKKRGSQQEHHYVETYDKYNQDGGGDALDYDDEPQWEDEEYWEEEALLHEEEDDENAQQDTDLHNADDLPPLPENPEELPLLVRTEARKGDVIVITGLVCDEMTKYEPKIVTRTATITDVPAAPGEEDLFSIQLAKRDLAPEKYDNEGRRLWSKFDMPRDESPSQQPGAKTLAWDELDGARLLLRGELAL